MAVFHLTTQQLWKAAIKAGEYRPPSLEAEGFIHFSQAEQILASANRFFANESNVLLLRVDESKLIAPLRDEPADGMMFPHLYGPLNLDAVENVRLLPRQEDGTFRRSETRPEDLTASKK